jgi:hypothetical protein
MCWTVYRSFLLLFWLLFFLLVEQLPTYAQLANSNIEQPIASVTPTTHSTSQSFPDSSLALLTLEANAWQATIQQAPLNIQLSHARNLVLSYKKARNPSDAARTLATLDSLPLTPADRRWQNLQQATIAYQIQDLPRTIALCLKLEADTGLAQSELLLTYTLLCNALIAQKQYLAFRSKWATLADRSLRGNKPDPAIGYPKKLDSLLSAQDRFFAQTPLPRQKSIRKSRTLSILLPASGLLYTKKPAAFATNVALQLASATYVAFNILTYNYVTAATFSFYLLRSFYTGGVNQSQNAAVAYTSKSHQQYQKRCRRSFYSSLSALSLN